MLIQKKKKKKKKECMRLFENSFELSKDDQYENCVDLRKNLLLELFKNMRIPKENP